MKYKGTVSSFYLRQSLILVFLRLRRIFYCSVGFLEFLDGLSYEEKYLAVCRATVIF